MNQTQSADSDDIMLSLTDAATHLGVSRSTLYRIIEDGRLPALKLRKNRRVRLADLEKLKEESWGHPAK